MKKIILTIETPRENRTVELEDELTIGRTSEADIELDDVGLSRVNTTFFRDGEMVFVVDENSTNGTFLNSEKVGREPERLLDGDYLKLGLETRVRVEIAGTETRRRGGDAAILEEEKSDYPKDKGRRTNYEGQNPPVPTPHQKSNKPPSILILAAASTFVIIFAALIAIFIASRYENTSTDGKTRPTPSINTSIPIPVRLIDPLGGTTPEDLQDLTQYWEVQEEEVEAADLQDITASAPADSKSPDSANLKVSVEFWKQQRARALAPRSAETGNDPKGQDIPRELYGDGVIKQKAKLAEMLRRTPPYEQPMDFAELALKKMKGELMELPMATEDYVLEVGGSSTTGEFTSFDFNTGSTKLAPGSPDYMILAQLASDFSGEKYDLTNPDHRRQMKIRLLRMFHPRAFPVLNEIAQAYRKQFNIPLRVTSLTRSMEYQISLNKTNPNSFKVRGAGSLPPHTSGCAFDLARKHMTADEQNFVMAKLAEMERRGILDALREGNLNACFHVFIYDDGVQPKL